MQYKPLPRTDLNVSRVCLGTMTWGEQNTEAQAHEQLDYAVGEGINFIDTAEMYPVPPNAKTQGRTESYLGTWLAKQQRDSLVIATKVAGPGRRDWIRDGRTDLTADVIADAVDTSLQRPADRLHRPVPDPLAATQRAELRRHRVRSRQGKGRPVDPRTGVRHGRDDQGRQNPLLRFIERDVLGRLRIPAGGRRAWLPPPRSPCRTATACCRATWTTTSPRRCSAKICRCSLTAR